MSFKRLRLGAVATALFVAACSASLRLAPVGVQSVKLSGTWMLDSSKSDNVEEELRLAMKNAAEKQTKGRGPRRGPGGEGPEKTPAAPADTGPPGGGPGGGMPWLQREQREQQDDLVRTVVPPAQLSITQAGSRIELVASGGRAKRSFEPDRPSSLITSYATLRIESGWQGSAFIVHSWDSSAKLDITERYNVTSNGELQEQLLLEIPQAKKQIYHIVYRRAG